MGTFAASSGSDRWFAAGVSLAIVTLALGITPIVLGVKAVLPAVLSSIAAASAALIALLRLRMLLRVTSANRTLAARNIKIDASLEESERRYRVLTDAMPQLMGIIDRELMLVYINKRCWTYTGQTVDEINDTAAAWIIHRRDQAQLAAAQSAIAANGEFACELRLRRSDGAYLWHSLRAVPLADATGIPRQWFFTATDIEQAKRAEAIIRESGARLARSAESDRAEATGLREANRLLIMAEEMAQVGHYRLNLVSNEVMWSDEVYRTYGLPRSFTPNLASVLSAYHPGDRDRVLEIMQTALVDGETFRFNARIMRSDATIRSVLISGQAERTPSGKITGLFGILQDVTSISNAEREREALSERVILATRAGKIGIWEWNTAADVLEWDSAMHALYGIDRSTVPTYELWLGCIHPDDRERSVLELQQAMAGEAPFDTEFRVIGPAGEVRHVRSMATLLRDSTGAGLRMVGANWDITETWILTDDLREEKERAEEANRTKSEFLARMSHEIRTPMNGLIGFATLVLDGELSAEQRRYVTLLGDAGRSLLAIINDILDFSKLEAGRIALERIPVDLAALVDAAVSIVRADATPKGIALEIELATELPAWVNGDPTRLRQILLNLLTNALKFTERGSIRVRVRRASPAHPDRLRFEIVDTGIGIAPELHHLLFTNFSQLEKSIMRRYGGTGLGLAICKRLVEAMDGEIGVASELGAGSCFWFTAELAEVAAPLPPTSYERPVPIAARRILVADDNRVNQIVVESLLRRDGHDVVVAEDGVQAVAAVRASHFDLVLMDMQMPFMDGVEATRAIRALPAPACDVSIIALTANAMAEEVERCHAAGMNLHLAKPIDRDRLRRAIADWTCDRPASAVTPRLLPPLPPPPQEEDRMQPNAHYTDTPTLGIATLLDIFDGDLAGVAEILQAALASIEIDLARIEESAASRDMKTVVEAAHRMKGTSGSIRSQRLLEISATIQHAAKHVPESINAALLRTLSDAVSELRADLAAHRDVLSISA
jgi:PAS domain S-box-containing protein